MSEHSAKIVKVEKVAMGNDGPALIFHAHCCGDPLSEMRHTSYLEGKSEEQIDAEVAAHLERTATAHATTLQIEKIMKKYLVE
jgi:hypothetical protein